MKVENRTISSKNSSFKYDLLHSNAYSSSSSFFAYYYYYYLALWPIVEPWPPDLLPPPSVVCCRHPVRIWSTATAPVQTLTRHYTSILTGLMQAVSRRQWDKNFPITSVSSCQSHVFHFPSRILGWIDQLEANAPYNHSYSTTRIRKVLQTSVI